MSKILDWAIITVLFFTGCYFFYLFIARGLQDYKDANNIEALAYNIYFEARNSTIEDQIATAVVVMNRGEPRKVVYEPGQFSWTVEYAVPADNVAFDRAYAIATMVYKNVDVFRRPYICKHYTVDKYYGPNHWTSTFDKRKKIGKHVYYC